MKFISHLVVFALAAQALSAVAQPVSIGNEGLCIKFGSAADGFPVTGIVNCLAGETRFVHSGSGCGLWSLDFVKRDTDGKLVHVAVDNRSPARDKRVERHGNVLSLVFSGVDLDMEKGVVDVIATVTLAPGKGASEWRIKVRNRSRSYALYETSYPRLDEIAEAGKADAFVPYRALGALWRRGFVREGDGDLVVKVPGWRPAVTAFNLGDAGLYIAAHDPEFRIKTLVIGADRSVRFDTLVENAGIPGKASGDPGYAVTIAAYRGDWWQVAKLYRAWALKQSWTVKGPIARRVDYPKAMADLDLICCFKTDDHAKMKALLSSAKRIWPDLKLGVNWYRWSKQPFCVNFPEFFPSIDGAKYAANLARTLGIPLAPYTDCRSWDEDLCSWAYAKGDACRDMDGKTTDEVYFAKHRLAVMCPSAEPWREASLKIVQDALATNTVNGCGFTGIYSDQIAAQPPVPCWTEGHGHQLGGGNWWTKGYRETFARIHDYCSSRGAIVFTEGTGDFCLDCLDGYLKASAPSEDEIPFFTAVYSGYAFAYGNYQSLEDPIRDFRAYQMRDFTRGVILGYFDRWSVAEAAYRPQQECIACLARIRRAAADFMVYGTLEDELRFMEEIPVETFGLKSVWRGYTEKLHLPVVMGTVWKDLSGSRMAVIAANASDVPRKVRIRLPVPGLRVVPVAGTETAKLSESGECGILELPPASAAFLCTK